MRIFLLSGITAILIAGCVVSAQKGGSNLSNTNSRPTNMVNANRPPLGNSNSVERDCNVDVYEPLPAEAPNYDPRASTTGPFKLDETTRKSLNEWFSTFATLEPFSEGKAKEESLRSFAIGRAFGWGNNPYPPEAIVPTARCRNFLNTLRGKRVDEVEITRIVAKYFLTNLSKHDSRTERIEYADGCYYCRDCGHSDGEMAFPFMVMDRIEAVGSGTYIAHLQWFEGMYSNYDECDCDKGLRQRIQDALSVGDYETIMKLCPQWGPTRTRKMRAKFKIVNAGQGARPILLSYENEGK